MKKLSAADKLTQLRAELRTSQQALAEARKEMRQYLDRWNVANQEANATIEALEQTLAMLEREKAELLTQLAAPSSGDRLLLNSYGRKCFNAGAESSQQALVTLKREKAALLRKSAVDDVAFDSANRLCVDAELRAEAAEQALAHAKEALRALQRDIDGMVCVEGPQPCRRCRMGAQVNAALALSPDSPTRQE